MRSDNRVLATAAAWLVALVACHRFAVAAPAGTSASASGAGAASVATDLFDAEAEGLVTVRFIPNNSRSAQVVVNNRTKRPLTLRLPAAFVGVPLLAQMGANQAGAGFGAGGIGAQPQTVGGGGGMGMGGMGAPGGAGGAAFSIPPEKTRVIKVRTVCLEHGKAEPAPRHAYKLDRYDSFSGDPALQGILEALGNGAIDPQAAQAAAWHLSSGLSWERLAAERIDHVVDEDEPFFTAADLLQARQAVARTMAGRDRGFDASGDGSGSDR